MWVFTYRVEDEARFWRDIGPWIGGYGKFKLADVDVAKRDGIMSAGVRHEKLAAVIAATTRGYRLSTSEAHSLDLT